MLHKLSFCSLALSFKSAASHLVRALGNFSTNKFYSNLVPLVASQHVFIGFVRHPHNKANHADLGKSSPFLLGAKKPPISPSQCLGRYGSVEAL